MPTLNYTLDLICLNCGQKQEHKVPKGSTFIAAKPNGLEESGYYKNYNKAENKTRKRCVNCRAATLVRESEHEN